MGSAGAGPARTSSRGQSAAGGAAVTEPQAISAASVGGYCVITVAGAGAGVGSDSRHAGPSHGFGAAGVG